MIQWEYKEHSVGLSSAESACNQMGIEGWELAGTFTHKNAWGTDVHLIFKRPITEKKNDHTPTDRPPNM